MLGRNNYTQVVHRVRMVAGKDGNPINELELLAAALMDNDGVLEGNNVIKFVPDQSVLKLDVGDRIALSTAQFERKYKAFLKEIRAKFSWCAPALRNPAIPRGGHDELVRHPPHPLTDQERHRSGHLAHVGERITRLVFSERRGLGRLDGRVDRQQSHVNAVGTVLLCRRLDERPGGEGAGGPQALARHRAPSRPSGDLHQRTTVGFAQRTRPHAAHAPPRIGTRRPARRRPPSHRGIRRGRRPPARRLRMARRPEASPH